MGNQRGPNCWQCQHFGVSWDPRMPYACKRMGFKSAVLPALEVLRADGQFCQSFTPKNTPHHRGSGAASGAKNLGVNLSSSRHFVNFHN